MIFRFIYTLLLMFSSASVFAATVGPIKDKACPDAWAITDTNIPVIVSTTAPWGANTDDKEQAKTYLSGADPVETIDVLPITDDELVDDLLTVASECLVYRNLLVDGKDYYPPVPPLERKITNGWIPAAVF